MRAFVRLRKILAVNSELARRLDELEKRVGTHDDQFVQLVQAIRQLMEPPPPANKGRFGFHMPEKGSTAAEEKPAPKQLLAQSRCPRLRKKKAEPRGRAV